MERVLNLPARRLLHRRRRPQPLPVVVPAVLAPGAAGGEWEIYRPGATAGLPVRQNFAALDAAAAALTPGERFSLELPLDAGLLQRLSLPPAEDEELEEMARIQLEKIMPYPAEAVGMMFQVVERRDTEVILAVQAVSHDRLLAFCQPLTARGCWPSQVTFHAPALALGAPAGETSALVYRESGKIIFGICENGRLSFAQALGAADLPAANLAGELPATLVGAEFEGVPVGFSLVRLDERCAHLREPLEDLLNAPAEFFSPAPAPGESGAGESDLSPGHWRAERLRSARAARFRRRVMLGVGAYAAAMLLGFVALGVLRFQVWQLDARLAADAPVQEAVRASEAKWKTLAPAIQPSRFLAEALLQICACLPPGDDVQLTDFDFKPGSVDVEGEAPSPNAAVDFSEKLKVRPELKMFRFDARPPGFLPNGRAHFYVSGKIP